jgi:hypothetical protein
MWYLRLRVELLTPGCDSWMRLLFALIGLHALQYLHKAFNHTCYTMTGLQTISWSLPLRIRPLKSRSDLKILLVVRKNTSYA